ncbi:hypothetical protein BMS3Abin08_00062 [bacterium BMS3Abin08]|nr:hypothetical protein BMS3Abin08_00062 [bacterium BMS3Abin08]
MPLAEKIKKRYTYKDYLAWPDEERWEIIGGDAYNMSPAPGIRHQRVVNRINIFLSTHKRLPERCTVFIAPTDVVLSEHDVVQPDVLVVCDEKKITEQNIQGVPDLVAEVLSPNTALKDKREKRLLYERVGVREYIIIDPTEQYVERYVLDDEGSYGLPDIFGPKEIMKLKAFEEIAIPLWEVYETEPPE